MQKPQHRCRGFAFCHRSDRRYVGILLLQNYLSTYLMWIMLYEMSSTMNTAIKNHYLYANILSSWTIHIPFRGQANILRAYV
jgi:hypothetical protein